MTASATAAPGRR